MPNHPVLTVFGLTAFALLAPQGIARSDANGADLCLDAAAKAASDSGVPYDVLLAVSVVETGRNGLPWPWTVNIGGDGHWAETEEEAAALVESALQAGLTNVDLGCFQLNLYWHAHAFTSVEDMLDPSRNASYAASFLAEKFAETGDWSTAAAAYHSGTPEYADLYQTKFEETWTALSGTEGATQQPETRLNGFPLLVAGLGASPGSLVPASAAGSPLIGGP